MAHGQLYRLGCPATSCYSNISCPVCNQHVSSGRIHGPCCLCADEQTDCAVYALDGLGDDISDAIAYVTLNPTCTAASAGDLACPSCPVEYMQQGLCLPGRCIQTASQATILNSTLWPASVCVCHSKLACSPVGLGKVYILVTVTACRWLQLGTKLFETFYPL